MGDLPPWNSPDFRRGTRRNLAKSLKSPQDSSKSPAGTALHISTSTLPHQSEALDVSPPAAGGAEHATAPKPRLDEGCGLARSRPPPSTATYELATTSINRTSYDRTSHYGKQTIRRRPEAVGVSSLAVGVDVGRRPPSASGRRRLNSSAYDYCRRRTRGGTHKTSVRLRLRLRIIRRRQFRRRISTHKPRL